MTPPLQAKIQKDVGAAMKTQDNLRLQTLRMLGAAIHNREIEKRGKGGSAELTEEEVQEVVKREAKKRKEAIELYRQGGRPELAEKESSELQVLEAYLPLQMSEDAVRIMVKETLAELGAVKKEEFGKIMGAVIRKTKGQADAALVSRILKEELG